MTPDSRLEEGSEFKFFCAKVGQFYSNFFKRLEGCKLLKELWFSFTGTEVRENTVQVRSDQQKCIFQV